MMTEREKAAAQLNAGMACEEALVRILHDCAAEIDAQLAVFLNSEAESGPHKARVALRRLTTALDAFAPVLRRRPASRARAEAKRIFRALGQVRDADVFLSGEGGPAAPARLQRETAALRQKLRGRLRRQKAVAFAPQLLRDLAGEGILKRSASGLAARQAPVGQLAGQQLDAAWLAALAHGTDLPAMTAEELHDFRKAMKTLRYLAEFFAPLWPAAARSGFRRALQLLQNDLGTLNDMAVAEARGRSPDPVKRKAALARAGRDWRRLAAVPPFWQSED